MSILVKEPEKKSLGVTDKMLGNLELKLTLTDCSAYINNQPPEF